MNRFNWHSIYLTLIVLIFIVLAFNASLAESPTFDEPLHLQDGISILTERNFGLDPFNPPLTKMMAALPVVFLGGLYMSISPYPDLIFARSVTIFQAVLLLVMVYYVGSGLFGKKVGALAMLILALEPTFFAHSHYVTPDIGLSLAVFSSISYIALIGTRWTKTAMIIGGLLIGLAAVTKIVGLIIIIFSFALVKIMLPLSTGLTKLNIRRALFIALVSLVIIWSVYFFKTEVIIKEREDPNRYSSQLRRELVAKDQKILLSMLTFFEREPVPLGMYMATVKNTLLRGREAQNVFFAGAHYDRSAWYFLPIIWILKTPLPLLFLSGLAIVAAVSKRITFKESVSLKILFTPVMVTFLIFSLSGANPMVRYVLPAIPFLAIVSSFSFFRCIGPVSIRVILLLWYAGGTAWFYPHTSVYANELAGPKEKHYQLFLDSNSDWGGGLLSLRDYIQTRTGGNILFSYFGSYDPAKYGFVGYQFHQSFYERCLFQPVSFAGAEGSSVRIVSVSNWYYCNYYQDKMFHPSLVRETVAGMYLVFR